MNRPNILIILSDEQRHDTLGCTGNPAAQTPHLDRLAEQGAVFDRCYTPFPLCCPARASLWTSRMARNHHVLGNWCAIRPEYRDDGLVADFARAGYHTLYSGKWHVPGTKPKRMGFADSSAIPAVLDGLDRGRYIEEYRAYATARGYELVPKMIENLTARDLAQLRQPGKAPCGTAEIALEHYIETWQTGQFLQTLARRPEGKPFFAVVSYSAPHFPMIVPEPYDRLIRPADIVLPPNFCAPLDGKPREVAGCHYYTDYTGLDEGEWRRLIAHYYGFCSLVDTQVGKILDALRRQRQLERTIVVYASDHGDMMGSHGMFQKGHPMSYEETNRVPLLLRHPDLAGGVRVASFASLLDVMPTLADFGGVALNRPVEGFSLAPLVQRPDGPAVRDSVTAETFLVDGEPGHRGEYFDPRELDETRLTVNMSIRTETDKYIYHMRDEDELYDIEADPWEMRNIAREAAARPRLESLRQRLLAEVRADNPRLASMMERAKE